MTHPKILKKRREERRVLERAMLRALRAMWMGGSDKEGKLSAETQVTLWGLEKARRGVGE